MRAFIQWLALAPLFVIAGCSTFQQTSRLTSSEPALSLSAADANLGEALAHYSQGLITESLVGTSQSALYHFKQAAALDPTQIPINLKVAADYIGRKDYTGAVSVLKSLELHHPDSCEIRLLLGSVYQALGNQDAAVCRFRSVIRLMPERPDGYIRLATFWAMEFDSRKAMVVIREGLRHVKDPLPLVEFCESMGRLFVSGKDISGAIPFFEQVLVYRSGDDVVRESLARCYVADGQDRKALAEFERLQKKNPDNPQFALGLGELQEMLGDREKALEWFALALKGRPEDLRLRLHLALLHMQREHYADALAQFDEVARHVEQDQSCTNQLPPFFYFWYGSACERAGRAEEGVQYLTRYLAANPDSAEALNYLAYVWAERGVNLDQAGAYIAKALKLEPDNGAYLDTQGWIQYKQGDAINALKSLKRAWRQAGDDPAILDHLRAVRAALKKR